MSPHAPRYLLVDRDGTLIVDRDYLSDPAKVDLIDGVARALAAAQAEGWRIIVLSNQSGVGRELFSSLDVDAVNDALRLVLEDEGVTVDAFYYCPHEPSANCRCRKPNTGMVEDAVRDFHFDPTQSVVIGDKASDIEMGHRIGAQTILVRTGYGAAAEQNGNVRADLVIESLANLHEALAKIR